MIDKIWINIGKITVFFIWYIPLIIAISQARGTWAHWPGIVSAGVATYFVAMAIGKSNA